MGVDPGWPMLVFKYPWTLWLCSHLTSTTPVTTMVKVFYFRAGRPQIPNFQTITQVQNSKSNGGPSTKTAMNLFQSFPQSRGVPAQSPIPKAVTPNGWQYPKLLILHGLYLGSPAFLFDSTLSAGEGSRPRYCTHKAKEWQYRTLILWNMLQKAAMHKSDSYTEPEVCE